MAFLVKESDLQKLMQITGSMKIKLCIVERENFRQTIEDLLEQTINPLLGKYNGGSITESMIVMDSFSEKRLDVLLKALKREQISLDYKAVTTPVNKKWTVLQMYLEMEREKNAYLQMAKEQDKIK